MTRPKSCLFYNVVRVLLLSALRRLLLSACHFPDAVMIQERQAARKAKDFKRADEIRDELLKKGIILKDTREGVKWQRA